MRNQTRSCWFTRSLSLAVCLWLVLPPTTAPAADVARVMPAETVAYAGASKLLDADSPQFALQTRLAASLAEMLEKNPDEDLAGIADLLKLIAPLQTESFGIGLFDVRRRGQEWEIDAALVVDAGEATAQLPGRVRALVESHAPDAEIKTRTIRSAEFAEVRLDETRIRVLWGLVRGRLVVATSQEAVERVMACVEDKAPNLADSAELKFDRNEVKGSADSRHACVYLNVPRGLKLLREVAKDDEKLRALLEPAMLDQLGLAAVQSLYWHLDTLDDRPRVASFLHVDGPRRGLLKLYEQPLLEESELAIVPRDAYWASAGNADLGRIWTELRGVLDEVAPDQSLALDSMLAMSTQMLGFSIVEDLLPALGDTWVMFDAPTHGGLLLSGTVLAIDVRQRDALQDMLARLLQMAETAAPGADFTLRRKSLRHKDQEIHYVLVGGVPCPVAPAWAYVGERVVIGLSPQSVVAALRQVDSATRGPSLLDNPRYRALREKLPREAFKVFYADSAYFARLFYPALTMLGTAGISQLAPYGAEITLELMPTVTDAVADVTALVGTASLSARGIRSDLLGDGADTLTAATLAFAASTVLGASSEQELDNEGLGVDIAVSMANLRAIASACADYAAEKDKLPDSLEVLVERNDLKPAMLVSPINGEGAYVYVRGGQSLVDIEHDERAVLVYEWLEDAELGLVAFVDGHVEAVKRDEFQKLMRETYKDVGREKDLPKQFKE